MTGGKAKPLDSPKAKADRIVSKERIKYDLSQCHDVKSYRTFVPGVEALTWQDSIARFHITASKVAGLKSVLCAKDSWEIRAAETSTPFQSWPV